MSFARQVMKLRGGTPFVKSQRYKSGFPSSYIPGGWGECSHVINGAPTQHMPLWVGESSFITIQFIDIVEI
jgi:hypothetical protein